jgi:hypothetical protein
VRQVADPRHGLVVLLGRRRHHVRLQVERELHDVVEVVVGLLGRDDPGGVLEEARAARVPPAPARAGHRVPADEARVRRVPVHGVVHRPFDARDVRESRALGNLAQQVGQRGQRHGEDDERLGATAEGLVHAHDVEALSACLVRVLFARRRTPHRASGSLGGSQHGAADQSQSDHAHVSHGVHHSV